MHIKASSPFVFWLMIVSMAIAVLPVWRSPIISSRWPRPMGIKASTAFNPVCTGSLTDCLGMMPGALTSARPLDTSLRGPAPSIGSPKPSTTRPNNPSPTGHVDNRARALDGVTLQNLAVIAEDHDANGRLPLS